MHRFPRLVVVLVWMWLGCSCLAAGNDNSSYRVVPDWPKLPAGYQFGSVPGIAIDSKERVFVFHRGANRLMIFERDGTFASSWGDDLIEGAHHLKIDRDGSVWLADYRAHVVRKCTADGKVLLTLGTPKTQGEDATHFYQPTDMAFASNGDIYVSDGYGNSRVVQFDREGKYIRTWGKKGKAPGQFNTPHAIAVDSKDRVYVADRGNARIQVFDRSGKFLYLWDQLLVPWGFHVGPKDEIWVCGSSLMPVASDGSTGLPPKDQLMLKINTKGKILERFGNPGGQMPGETDWVHCIAVSPRGEVYVGDIQGKRAQKFVRAP